MSEDRDKLLSNIPLMEQIERAKHDVLAEVIQRLEAIGDNFTTRLDAMDKAAVLLDANVNRVPTLLDREALRIKELSDQKFDSIQRQLIDRDSRSESDKASAQSAVAAALQAQKEAAAKSDTSTEKQLEALARRVDDIKERLDSGEGTQRGSIDTRQDQRAERNSWMQVASFCASLFAILVTILLAMLVLPHAPSVPVTVTPPAPSVIGPAR